MKQTGTGGGAVKRHGGGGVAVESRGRGLQTQRGKKDKTQNVSVGQW